MLALIIFILGQITVLYFTCKDIRLTLFKSIAFFELGIMNVNFLIDGIFICMEGCRLSRILCHLTFDPPRFFLSPKTL